MATEHSRQSTDSSQPNFDEIDSHLLEQTVEKLVRYGQQVGVTLSIHDLLAFLAAKLSGAA